MVRNESRSNATPRLGWSGAEELATPALSDETLRFLYKLLGGPHSSIEKVGTKIRELGASYQRYLHQDEFGWLRFIGVREVVTLTLEHTWDGRAVDMIDAAKRRAVELARQF